MQLHTLALAMAAPPPHCTSSSTRKRSDHERDLDLTGVFQNPIAGSVRNRHKFHAEHLERRGVDCARDALLVRTELPTQLDGVRHEVD